MLIAITWGGGAMVEVLDSLVLQQFRSLEIPQDIGACYKALAFSPDSHILTGIGSCGQGRWHRRFVTSWDLQTGGAISVVELRGDSEGITEGPSAVIHSANGKVGTLSEGSGSFEISIFDVASGALTHSYSIDGRCLFNTIWTHGEFVRFMANEGETVAILEVGIASIAGPTNVETIPPPHNFLWSGFNTLFHPASCRSALSCRDWLGIRDLQTSKLLLECRGSCEWPIDSSASSFSSDGRWFAHSIVGSADVYIWMESSAEYVLRGILDTSIMRPCVSLSQGGKSIAVFGGGRTIKLWDTDNFATFPLPSTSADPFGIPKGFSLSFSPDGTLVAVATQGDTTATVLNLRSGVGHSTIDVGVKVFGIRVVGNKVAVVGNSGVFAWDLPTGEDILRASVDIWGCTQMVGHKDFLCNAGVLAGAAISPDFKRCAVIEHQHWHNDGDSYDALIIYDISTGCVIFRERMGGVVAPWLTQDGRHAWAVANDGQAEVRSTNDEGETWSPGSTVNVEGLPEESPWTSTRGYQVTDDWWILGPDGGRLLILPPPWRSYVVQRVWKDQFLALLHATGLPEPVILELEVQS